MFDFSDIQGKVSLAVIILFVLVVGYFVWTRSAPPAPKPLPGQSLQNPLGSAAPGPVGPSPNAPYAGRR
jgi:hypothetical protein